MTLTPTSFFYSYHGYDQMNNAVAFGSGQIERATLEKDLSQTILDIAQSVNEAIVNVHIVSLTPVEFEVVDG